MSSNAFVPIINVARLVFFTRNADKAFVQGDFSRAPVTFAHGVALTDEVSKATTLGGASQAAGKAADTINKVGKSVFNIENVAGKASKLVNPLIIGAAGYRVLKDEDKKSALVEESLALGAMFGAETVFKSVKKPLEMLVQQNGNVANVAKDLASSKEGAKSLLDKLNFTDGLADKLSVKILNNEKGRNLITKAAAKISSMTKGQKTAAGIGIGLAFAAISICAFSAGKKLGQKITGRTAPKEPETDKNFFVK